MPSQKGISVIICTYNREELLIETIEAIEKVKYPKDKYQVIIVNNYPALDLTYIVSRFKAILDIQLIIEKRAGLSIARNKGLVTAKYDWVAYLDDDALVHKDWLTIAEEIIKEEKFSCFGGVYRPWWKYERPKWLPQEYGSKPLLAERRSKITEGYNWGSNIFFERSTLLDIGGFPEHLGMKANTIGYAEETFVQQKLRQKGKTIGFDPNLIIYHLVGEHKLKPNWHIKAAYADARDQKTTFPTEYKLKTVTKDFVKIFTSPLKAALKLLIRKDYFYQNFKIESLSPVYKFVGKLQALTH